MDENEVMSEVSLTAEIVEISAEELAALREENERFKAEAERKARLEAESEELQLLYPEADVTALPDEVAENWEKGMLLAAAYALWDKRRSVAEANAETANRLNGEASAGPVANDGSTDGSFTLEDIRRMPRAEVRNYLDRIYRSLEKYSKNKK